MLNELAENTSTEATQRSGTQSFSLMKLKQQLTERQQPQVLKHGTHEQKSSFRNTVEVHAALQTGTNLSILGERRKKKQK